MKRTYQPSRLVRKRRHGFRSRMKTKGGRRVLARLLRPGTQEAERVIQRAKLAVLRKRASFLAIAQSGKKWVAPGLILQAGPAPKDTTELRYGLTASGKIGGAVVRNRAKRRLRAIVGEILPRHAAADYDYVLIARAATGARDFSDLQQDLKTALKKLGAWRD